MLQEQESEQQEVQQARPPEPRTEPPAKEGQRVLRMVETRRERLIWGAGLLLFGALTLLGMLTGWDAFGLAIMPALATLFLVVGIVLRLPGFFIPSGILFGVGAGTILASVLEGQLSGQTIGGIVVGSIGLGFLLIMGLQALFTPPTHWWPLIPGGIMVSIGMALVIGGAALGFLELLGYLWPVALIALGAWLLWRAYRGTRDDKSGGAPTQ